ncbi:MFS transporter [Rhizobium rhizogenes]|uniref:MFS transporter n=1 Tax=Rhizobium rhizogenes TaxID=359 RepID=UPI000646D988|nr:MFS transporter [Rhizobium rhizogenes]
MIAARSHEADAPDWAAIAIVILSVTAFAIAQGLTFPLISLMLQGKGISGRLIGLNAAGYAVGAATAVLMIDKLTARFRGDRLIIAALFGCSVCLAAFALTDHLLLWFAARFVIGFCASLISILSGAWLNTASPNRIRGRISGFYGAGMCAGFAAGPLAIPLLGTENGFAFALVAVYVALIGFASVAFSGNTRTLPQRAPTGALFRFIRAAPVLVLMELAFGFADIAAISGMAVYFVRVGHSEAFAAYAITVLSLPTALAQPLVGWLLDRTSRAGVAFGCGLLGAVVFLLIPFLHSEAAILVAFAVIGAATFALSTCALTILGERFEGGMLVAGTASFSLAYSAGSVMGSTGTGFVMDLISPAAVPTSVGLGLLAFTVLMAFKRP